LLNAKGGHPDVAERSAIRRWTAREDGVISISGELSHGSANGDGVRGRIVSSRSGIAGEWVARNGSVGTPVADLNVQAGDTIDFVTDSLEGYTSDSFNWTATITLRSAGGAEQTFSSAEGFRGPTESTTAIPGQVIRAWQLALSREPTDDELRLAMTFLGGQLRLFREDPAAIPTGRTAVRQAMTNLCQSLLSCNEFLYVE
jgi:hypothetical protein